MSEESGLSKAILVVCDGLGDRPTMERGTPLQATDTPNWDAISEAGINGLMDVIAPGIVPGSDTAHLAIFGYDPCEFYPGRGVFEVLGANMPLKKGDVAFRANFATVDADMRILDRRAGRKGSKELAEALNGLEIEDVRILLKNTVEHRCAVVMTGANLSRDISDVDSHVAGSIVAECNPHKAGAAEKKTASIVNEFVRRSYELLNDHPENEERRRNGELPANIILLRGAGSYEYEKVPPMSERFGFSSACVAGASLYKGIAKYIGMDVIPVDGATGKADTNLNNKAEAALQAMKHYEFVFVHIKAADSMGHDGDFEGKCELISRIDSEFMARLRDADAYITITADHSTPVSIKRHSSDPTPIVIKGEGVRRDEVKKFDEISVASGGLGRIKGLDLVPILSDFMGYYRMYGT